MEREKYIDELGVLYNKYNGKDLEPVIGVSIRSMQNYLKKENPAIPRPEVINKIREAFANHEKGLPLTMSKNNDTNNTVESLAQSNQILATSNAKMVDAILEKVALLDEIKSNLDKIPDSMGLLTDLILKGQEQRMESVLQQFADLKNLVSSQKASDDKKPLRHQKR